MLFILIKYIAQNFTNIYHKYVFIIELDKLVTVIPQNESVDENYSISCIVYYSVIRCVEHT